MVGDLELNLHANKSLLVNKSSFKLIKKFQRIFFELPISQEFVSLNRTALSLPRCCTNMVVDDLDRRSERTECRLTVVTFPSTSRRFPTLWRNALAIWLRCQGSTDSSSSKCVTCGAGFRMHKCKLRCEFSAAGRISRGVPRDAPRGSPDN